MFRHSLSPMGSLLVGFTEQYDALVSEMGGRQIQGG